MNTAWTRTLGIFFVAMSASAASAAPSAGSGADGSLPVEQPTPLHADASVTHDDGHQGERSLERSAATEVVQPALTQSAFGASALVVGGAGMGEARGNFESGRDSRLGGGVRVWGSPLERLTLQVDAERRNNDRFAPSANAMLRFLGGRPQRWALGALGRYKAEGFAELEGEFELGLLGSIARDGLHLDVNVVVGAGFEESEADGELLARGGYDVLDFLRVGAEGRARYRLSGDVKLTGNRTWDAMFGPQVLAHYGHVFGALSGGPSTVGISASVGWEAMLTAGSVAF